MSIDLSDRERGEKEAGKLDRQSRIDAIPLPCDGTDGDVHTPIGDPNHS